MKSRLPTSILSITSIYSTIQFLYYFNFFWLIQNVYILNSGINFKQLALLHSIWSISIFLLEIPSGILADKLGRKPIIVIGKLGFLLGILGFIYLKSFWGFALAMVFWGIHESFISGALEALVYDDIKSRGHQNKFDKVTSIATVSREIGLGIGVLIAGFVTQINIQYNLIGSVIIAALGVIVALILPNPAPTEEAQETHYLHFFKNAWSAIRSNTNLLTLVAFAGTVIVSYQVISEYFVVSLEKLNISFQIIGLLAFLEMLFFTLGAFIAQKVKNVNNWTYGLLAIGMAIGMSLITLKSTMLVIGAWMFLRTVKAMAEVISNVDWQNRVSSHDRATTTSIRSFVSNVVFVPFALIFGAIADSYGLFNAFVFTAVISLSFAAISTIIKPFTHQTQKTKLKP